MSYPVVLIVCSKSLFQWLIWNVDQIEWIFKKVCLDTRGHAIYLHCNVYSVKVCSSSYFRNIIYCSYQTSQMNY